MRKLKKLLHSINSFANSPDWKVKAPALIIFLAGCGDLKMGNIPAPNDPPPSGARLSSGSFISQNGKSVSGIASIYQKSSNGLMVVRIEGLSAPDETGLSIQAMRGSEIAFRSNLRSTSGTQNYSTQKSETTGWSSVQIISSNTQTLYGTANLEAVKTDFYPNSRRYSDPYGTSSPTPTASPVIDSEDSFAELGRREN